MARANAAAKEAPAPKRDDAAYTKITYKPIHQGDPFKTKVHGHAFEANIPKKFHSEKHKEIIDHLAGNPWFHVEGRKQAKQHSPTGEPLPPPGTGESVAGPEMVKPGGKAKELDVTDKGDVIDPATGLAVVEGVRGEDDGSYAEDDDPE